MGSFKLRLVVYFVLLSLVPLAGVTWAYSAASTQNELRHVDETLHRAALAAGEQISLEVARAGEQASQLAERADVQRALRLRDRAALARVAETVPGASFSAGGELLAGTVPPQAAMRVATVVDGAETLGEVRVAVALDAALLAVLRQRIGLEDDELLALAPQGATVIGGPPGLAGRPSPRLDEVAADVEADGEEYRFSAASVRAGDRSLAVLALAPRSSIASDVTSFNLRLVGAALGSVAIVALVAFLPGRAIVRALGDLARAAAAIADGRLSERVPVRGRDEFARVGHAFNEMAHELESQHAELRAERDRVRRALARLGTALTAGTEPAALLEVVAESAFEATGAAGVRVVAADEELVRLGRPEAGGDRVEIPFGAPLGDRTATLELVAPADAPLSSDGIAAARSLVAQGTIALDNARLHESLFRQAVTDELTQLANRRRFEEALEHEIGRVRRFGGAVSLLLADLDDFKAVNDTHGHLVGDDVLRTFAEVLRGTVRGIDVAARPGGEEFAAILPGAGLAEASLVATRVRRALTGRSITAAEGPITVTASFGVAAYEPGMTADDLVAAADQALYAAKAQGKDRVVAARVTVDQGGEGVPATGTAASPDGVNLEGMTRSRE